MMMRRLAGLAIVLGVLSAGCERAPQPTAESSSSPASPGAPSTGEATRPAGASDSSSSSASSAPPSAIATESDVIRDLRRRAEGGDITAMMTLGRAYQSRGTEKDRAEARRWYEKADAAGSRAAKEAMATLDAEALISSAASAAPTTFPSLPSLPPPSSAIPHDAAAAGASPAATTRAVAAAPSAPSTGPATAVGKLDRSKLTWKELVASYDSTDFATVDRPDYKKMFVGLSTAEDQTMILAATGPTGDEVRNVKLLIRVRSRQDPAEAQRVTQAATIAATITRDNVTRAEMIEWVKNYLASEQRSEPIYRNGWQITVSGPVAENQRDPKSFLGNAVVIEFKR
jgi:hypothetical protein